MSSSFGLVPTFHRPSVIEKSVLSKLFCLKDYSNTSNSKRVNCLNTKQKFIQSQVRYVSGLKLGSIIAYLKKIIEIT